jgi:hypothetical protein
MSVIAPTISTHFMLYPSAHKLSAGPIIFPQNQNFDFTVLQMGKKETPNQLLLHILTMLRINVLHLKFLCT